jgi:hypothetical protein
MRGSARCWPESRTRKAQESGRPERKERPPKHSGSAAYGLSTTLMHSSFLLAKRAYMSAA